MLDKIPGRKVINKKIKNRKQLNRWDYLMVKKTSRFHDDGNILSAGSLSFKVLYKTMHTWTIECHHQHMGIGYH